MSLFYRYENPIKCMKLHTKIIINPFLYEITFFHPLYGLLILSSNPHFDQSTSCMVVGGGSADTLSPAARLSSWMLIWYRRRSSHLPTPPTTTNYSGILSDGGGNAVFWLSERHCLLACLLAKRLTLTEWLLGWLVGRLFGWLLAWMFGCLEPLWTSATAANAFSVIL